MNLYESIKSSALNETELVYTKEVSCKDDSMMFTDEHSDYDALKSFVDEHAPEGTELEDCTITHFSEPIVVDTDIKESVEDDQNTINDALGLLAKVNINREDWEIIVNVLKKYMHEENE